MCQCRKCRRNRGCSGNNSSSANLNSTCAQDSTVQGGSFYSAAVRMTVPGVNQTTQVTEVIPVVFQQTITQDTIVNQVYEVQGVEYIYQQGQTVSIAPTYIPTCNSLEGTNAGTSTGGNGCGCR